MVAGPPAGAGSARKRARVALTAAMLALVGIIAGLLSWLRPVPSPVLLPLWVGEYRKREVPRPVLAAADLQAIESGGYFTHTIGDFRPAQIGYDIMARLTALRRLPATEAVVVYVCAYSHRLTDGRLALWPADADPDLERSWVPLREVLESLRDCPAQHKLLVLDIMRPLVDARLGVLRDDVAAGVPDELNAVPDDRRLVLCACSPGQVALVSETMGRSVFGNYFEEALRGRVEPSVARLERDGLVHVKELAEFVRARVSRWAWLNRATHQEPILYGSGEDFALRALPNDPSSSPRPIQDTPTYPTWLLEGWKLRDQWWNDESYRVAPRVFRQLEAESLTAEAQWRSDPEQTGPPTEWTSRLADFANRLAQARDIPHPQPRSLGLAVALDWKPDDSVAEALREVLVSRAEQLRTAPPDKAAPAIAKLADDFLKKTKAASDRDLAWAVFNASADDDDPRPETIRFLDGLLRTRQTQPLFVETLFLSRLAQLAESAPAPADWPVNTVHRALQVVRMGEEADSQAESLAWVRDLLDTADRDRHDGEVFLRARGLVPPGTADPLLKRAAEQFEAILSYQETIRDGKRSLDRALAILPKYPPYLENAPNLEDAWHAAILETDAIRDAISVGLALVPEQGADLGPQLDTLRHQVAGLNARIDDLLAPFQTEAVSQLLHRAGREDAGPNEVIQIDAKLDTPFLRAADRAALWSAGRELSRRLLEATERLDLHPDSPWEFPVTAGPQLRDDLRAGLRARTSLALLRLGGLGRSVLQPMEEVFARTQAPGADRKSWYALGLDLRQAWSEELPAALRGATDPAVRVRMGWIVPTAMPLAQLDNPRTAPTVLLRTQMARALWARLADRYAYEGRDFGGSSLLLIAARDCRDQAGAADPGADLRIDVGDNVPDLTPERLSATVPLRLRLVSAPTPNPTVAIDVLRADSDWLDIAPVSAAEVGRRREPSGPDVASSFSLPGSALGEWTVPLQVELQLGAELSGTPPPEGFLVQVQVEGRNFHEAVPVSLRSASNRLLVFLSADPKVPTAPQDALRLRPVAGLQPYYLYVQNPANRPRNLDVEVSAEGAITPAGRAKLTVGARQTAKVDFGSTAPQAGANLPELQGPLLVRLLDADDQDAEVQVSRIDVAIASPREYVRVSDTRFVPADVSGSRNNLLSVGLRAMPSLAGPPPIAELVLSPLRIPGLIPPGQGSFRGRLPTDGSEVTLVAQDIRFQPGSRHDGTFSVMVDGYANAFTFALSFPQGGGPIVPREVNRPGLRLVADSIAAPGPGYSVTAQVDNEPSGSSLELALGQIQPGGFVASQVRTFPEARNRRVGFHAGGSGGALLFEASIADWSESLDTTGLLGRRDLRARLLDSNGRQVAVADLAIILDASPPTGVAFVDPPQWALQGQPLSVTAAGFPTDSGITSATFFIGRPAEDKVPSDAATVPGTAQDPTKTTWSATLPIPSGKSGPIDISVQLVSGAGAASFATMTVPLRDSPPPVTGTIRGVVLEGPRPQPALDVTLAVEKGDKKDQTKTSQDGTFTFRGVAPGKYKVSASKTASNTYRETSVSVDPSGTADPAAVTLELLRVR